MSASEIGNLVRRNRDIGLQDDPQFNKARKYYDWRNYVPDEVRKVWKDLSPEARVMSFLVAKTRAETENYCL